MLWKLHIHIHIAICVSKKWQHQLIQVLTSCLSPSPPVCWPNQLPAFSSTDLDRGVFVPVIPELAQCQGAASLWRQCVAPGSVYSVSAQSFMATLAPLYSTRTTERAHVTAETGTTPAPSQCLSAYVPCHMLMNILSLG